MSPLQRSSPGVLVRRATPKQRRELHAAQVDAALEQRTITQRVAAEVVHQIAGLPVAETANAAPTTQELLVEVQFSGHRSGRLTVGFSRGLTRQVGAGMAAMVDLDGRPLNPVEAAKELTCAIAHAVLGVIFGEQERPRLQIAQTTTPRQFGVLVSVLKVADGFLVVDLQMNAAGG